MNFADYTELTDPPIRLPFAGVEYELPAVGVNDVDTVNRSLETGNDGKDRPSDAKVEGILLGDAGEQMVADGVPMAFKVRALKVAVADFRYGRPMAEAVWATNGQPAALADYFEAKTREAAAEGSETPAGEGAPTSV